MKSSPYSSQYVGSPLTRSSSPCLRAVNFASSHSRKRSRNSAVQHHFLRQFWLWFVEPKSTIYTGIKGAIEKQHLLGARMGSHGSVVKSRKGIRSCWTKWIWGIRYTPLLETWKASHKQCVNDLTADGLRKDAAQHRTPPADACKLCCDAHAGCPCKRMDKNGFSNNTLQMLSFHRMILESINVKKTWENQKKI